MQVISKDREEMKALTNKAWWKRPVCWSGIRQDLDALTVKWDRMANNSIPYPDLGSDYYRRQAERFRRLAIIAQAQEGN